MLAPLFSSKMMPAARARSSAVALAVGLTPVGAARPARSPLDALAARRPGGQGAARRPRLRLRARRAVRRACSVAGSLLDTLIGFSFGALVDPITGNQSPVLSQLYALVGVLIFIAIGGDALGHPGPRAHLRRSCRCSSCPRIGSLVARRAARVLGDLRRRARDRRAGDARADHHRRRVRRRLPRRAAAERLRGRLPGQDHRRPAADRRLAAVRRRLDRRPAAAVASPTPSRR